MSLRELSQTGGRAGWDKWDGEAHLTQPNRDD